MISPSKRYLLIVQFGRIKKHGLHIYSYEQAVQAKQRLVNVGAKESNIKIATYESIFGSDIVESKIIKCAI